LKNPRKKPADQQRISPGRAGVVTGTPWRFNA